jgi:vitamin K-dependent gamma-carboxylase
VTTTSRLSHLRPSILFQPVDGSFAAFFRIVFGLVMFVDIALHLGGGAVEHIWAAPRIHFKYYGFEWVHILAGQGMHLLFAVLGVLSICVALGLFYRFTSTLLFLGFTYTFLAEKAAYQNHFYLLCLISFFMIWIPAHRNFSIDSWRGWVKSDGTVAVWTLWLLRGQIAIVYFFGGLAKLNYDWLHGEPMRLWLTAYGDYWLIGPYVREEWLVAFFIFGGLGLDLFIAPLLLWSRTRYAAFAVSLTFHLLNNWIFRIGIFPWFMIGATPLFLAPDWPRRALARWRGQPFTPAGPITTTAPKKLTSRQLVATTLLAAYAIIQLLAPLRHMLYPGDPSWTEQGHRFAWRMMLRDKRVDAQFTLRDPRSKIDWPVRLDRYLVPWQRKVIVNDPDMVLQFCHYLKKEKERQGFPDYEVYAQISTSLNGRRPQLMLDPTVDLASQSRTLLPAPWIKPLQTKL